MYTCYFHCPADYVLWQDDAFRTEIMSIITDDSSIIIQFISEEEQLDFILQHSCCVVECMYGGEKAILKKSNFHLRIL